MWFSSLLLPESMEARRLDGRCPAAAAAALAARASRNACTESAVVDVVLVVAALPVRE